MRSGSVANYRFRANSCRVDRAKRIHQAALNGDKPFIEHDYSDIHSTLVLTIDAAALAFQHFLPYFSSVRAIQLVKDCKREKTFENGLEIRKLIPWLTKLSLID